MKKYTWEIWSKPAASTGRPVYTCIRSDSRLVFLRAFIDQDLVATFADQRLARAALARLKAIT